jgi:hypothetical protein
MTTRNVDIFIRQAIDNYKKEKKKKKKQKKKKKKKKIKKKERRKKLTHEHEQGLIYKHRPYYCFLFLTNLQYVSLMLLNIKKKKTKKHWYRQYIQTPCSIDRSRAGLLSFNHRHNSENTSFSFCSCISPPLSVLQNIETIIY